MNITPIAHCGLGYCGFPDRERCDCECLECNWAEEAEYESAKLDYERLAQENAEDEQAKYH